MKRLKILDDKTKTNFLPLKNTLYLCCNISGPGSQFGFQIRGGIKRLLVPITSVRGYVVVCVDGREPDIRRDFKKK